MTPRIAIFVRGGVVQEVASDTANVLIKRLDMDSIEAGDPPDEWHPPDVVISKNSTRTPTESTSPSDPVLSPITTPRPPARVFFCLVHASGAAERPYRVTPSSGTRIGR